MGFCEKKLPLLHSVSIANYVLVEKLRSVIAVITRFESELVRHSTLRVRLSTS